MSHGHGHSTDTDSHGPYGHRHIVPISTYLIVFAALMILLIITVVVAYLPLGYFNLPVAMTIAIIKGVLIVMYFMEVKYGNRLLWVFAASSFIWLLILFVLTLNDYATRGWISAGH
jgi:cytochrome c oxidase subunit IV